MASYLVGAWARRPFPITRLRIARHGCQIGTSCPILHANQEAARERFLELEGLWRSRPGGEGLGSRLRAEALEETQHKVDAMPDEEVSRLVQELMQASAR
jgi:hypothetical protein